MPPMQIAVIAGGPSAEAAVSQRSALGVQAALLEAGFTATIVELNAALPGALIAGRYDVVFPVTHGPLGEDGGLQGLLEVLRLPYVGSGVLASALGAHKPSAKVMFRRAGLPVADEVSVLRGEDTQRAAERALLALGSSLIVKPSSGGSAIGVVRLPELSGSTDLVAALNQVLRNDDALVERFHRGFEVTCGVLEDEQGLRALPPTLIRAQAADWYDFRSRYQSGGSQHECPAPLGEATVRRVQQLAEGAHRAVGARDLSRIDFVVEEGGDVIVLEINTLPGMTKTSNFPEAAAVAGIGFPELCRKLVLRAVARPLRLDPEVQAIPASDNETAKDVIGASRD
jgi:D-alanine-D-alanine ligase